MKKVVDDCYCANNKIPVINGDKCIRCLECVDVCPQSAIKAPSNNSCAKCVKYCITMEVPCTPSKVIFDYKLCDSCGKCVEVCKTGAIYFLEQNKKC